MFKCICMLWTQKCKDIVSWRLRFLKGFPCTYCKTAVLCIYCIITVSRPILFNWVALQYMGHKNQGKRVHFSEQHECIFWLNIHALNFLYSLYPFLFLQVQCSINSAWYRFYTLLYTHDIFVTAQLWLIDW